MGGRSRVKRKAVQSEDGWTVITHGLGNISLKSSDELDKEKDQDTSTQNGKSRSKTGSLPGVVHDLTVASLTADFERRREKWADTEIARQVRDVLEGGRAKEMGMGMGRKGKRWNVDHAACIGIGSFSRDWEHRHRCMWQLVLFVWVVDILKEQNPHLDINMSAQDPAFTPIDTAFLLTLHIPVTQSIAHHISPTTFVFAPFVDWFLLLPSFIKHNDPELYIGNAVEEDYSAYAQTEDRLKVLEECNELGRGFLRGRECVVLRGFELHAHALNGVVVYWKKKVDGDGDGENEEEEGEEEKKEEKLT